MTQAPAQSGLVRVSVASGARRVDLVLPGTVPVAELLPELVRCVGLLDPATVHGGYRLVTTDGRTLAPEVGLAAQGVDDGGLLSVAAGVDDRPPRVYDDVVEAMADVVEQDLTPWEPAAGRRTALWSAGLLMALGATALLVQRGTPRAGLGAAVVALALAAAAIVLSRAHRETDVAVTVAWMAGLYAGVAGLLLVPGEPLLGAPAAAAGGAALVAGLACLLGLGEGRALATPPAVVGAIFLAAWPILRVSTFAPAVVLTVALVLVVLSGGVFPWLALGATSTSADPLATTEEPRAVDPALVGTDARLAHEILVAISATVGLLLLLAAPLAASLGVAGVLLAVACCLVVVLRTRHHRTRSEVLVGLGSGVLGLASTGAATLWLHPDWRPAVAVSLAGAGAVLLVGTMLPESPSVRRGRLGDLAESAALLVLLPLLVVASGVLSAIHG